MGMSNRISIRQRQAKNTLLHIILEVPENYPWFRVFADFPNQARCKRSRNFRRAKLAGAD